MMKYTRKQIREAIKHWQKQLKTLDENDYDSSSKCVLILVSNYPEDNYIESFDTENEALKAAKSFIDFDTGFPCVPGDENRRFNSVSEAIQFLRTNRTLMMTDHTSYSQTMKLIKGDPETFREIFDMQ